MKKVNQKENHKKTGDCMRASIASVLEVDLQAVPHLTRTPEDKWFSVMYYFLISYGYIYSGMWYPSQPKRSLRKGDSFSGFYLAVVSSKTHKGKTHMVVMDDNWKVVHDPNPNKHWQNKKLLGDQNFKHVYKFRKMNKTDKNYWYYI